MHLLLRNNSTKFSRNGCKKTMRVGLQSYLQTAVMTAHDAIIESRIMQMHNTNRQGTKGAAYTPGDLVYLSTKNLTLPKGRAKKIAAQVYWAVQGCQIT